MGPRFVIFALTVLFYGECSGERARSTYMGCFNDSSIRLLDGAREDSDVLTPESCVDFCYRRRFQLAGVEYGKECFCGDSLKGQTRLADTDCGKQCSGDPTRVCGGEWRIGIYNTGLMLGEAAKMYIYTGCYTDRQERVLNGSSEVSDTLTPLSCVVFCYKRQYSLAGVEYGRECFCGNNLNGSDRRDDSECNYQCDGDHTRNCGGPWRISVYNTGFINFTKTETVPMDYSIEDVTNLKAKYMGCYIELSPKARLMRGYQKDFSGRLTNFLCQTYCKGLGFLYAGTQWKKECFCSNKRPSYKSRTYDDECSDPCDGNNKEICGGSLRISIYDISGSTENSMSQNYEGCYSNSGFLTESRGTSDLMTPEYCTALCYRDGFGYAGVNSGNNCRCGNSLMRRNKMADNACKTPCKGDAGFDCGGDDMTSSVYKTGVPPASSKPVHVGYEGCYEDSEERVLLGTAVPTSLLTKDFCIDYCYRKAYRFAGLEYGFECYCGDTLSMSKEVSDRECKMPCSGNATQKCGSSWRINVYSIQFPVPESSEIEGGAVSEIINSASPAPEPMPLAPPKCPESETLLFGERPCQGDVLLDEQFTSNEIDTKRWSYSVYMPEDPDHQFVVYRKEPENVYVKDGVLFIKPTVMDDEMVRQGSILLRECTGIPESYECKRMAEKFNILPPINSARIHTRDALSFRYGKVEVRAKLPVGDWIVPEIWLEPKDSEYGAGYASGRVRMAMARGNKQLKLDDWEMGNTLLESGILLGVEDDVRGRTVEWNLSHDYHDDFHTFTFLWSPGKLTFSVDGGKEFNLVNRNQTLSEGMNFDEKMSELWKNGTAIAPFDQEFYVSLGLSVGGVRDFPDDAVSGSYKKPWKNAEVKAMANFWLASDKWQPTWSGEDSALQVDYVKVTAL